jgi:indolepyruvate ferredoxin oxidoreductase beta subunit
VEEEIMIMEKDPLNIIITGVGGQGNVLASQLLGQILVKKGYFITIGETYGASQRGGSVVSHMRVSLKESFSPLIPEGAADVVIGLEPVEALRVLSPYGNPEVICLVNTRPIHPIDVIAGNQSYPEFGILEEKIKRLSKKLWKLNATEIAMDLGDPILSNIVMLGALMKIEIVPIDEETFRTVASELLPEKKMEANLEAFRKGAESI